VRRRRLGRLGRLVHRPASIWLRGPARSAARADSNADRPAAGGQVSSVYDQTAPTPVFARPCSHTVDTQRSAPGLAPSPSGAVSR
jgi:hypothetical protein